MVLPSKRKRERVATNLSVIDFDRALIQNALDNKSYNVWVQTFINYTYLRSDCFAFISFRALSLLPEGYKTHLFQQISQEFQKESTHTVPEQLLQVYKFRRDYIQFDLFMRLFENGYREWQSSGKPTQVQQRTKCSTRNHSHNSLCLLLDVLPQNDENFSLQKGFHRVNSFLDLVSMFLANLYQHTCLKDSEEIAKLRNSSILACVINHTGFLDSTSVRELRNITNTVEEEEVEQELVRYVKFFIKLRELSVWGQQKNSMWMRMQMNQRGAAQFHFNLLDPDLHFSSLTSWDLPSSGKMLRIEHKDSSITIPDLYHILLARYAIESGDEDLLEEQKWYVQQDMSCVGVATTSRQKQTGKARRKQRKVVVMNCHSVTPGDAVLAKRRKECLSPSMRRMTTEEIKEWIESSCRLTSNTYLFFSEDVLKNWEQDSNGRFSLSLFRRSPDMNITRFLNTIITERQKAQEIIQRSQRDANSVIVRILHDTIWHTEWLPNKQMIRITKPDDPKIYQGCLAYLSSASPLIVSVIHSMDQLLTQLSSYGGAAVTEEIVKSNPGNATIQLLKTVTPGANLVQRRCRVLDTFIGPGHVRDDNPKCCIWNIFKVHGKIMTKQPDGSKTFETYGGLDYSTTETNMRLALEIKKDIQVIRKMNPKEAKKYLQNQSRSVGSFQRSVPSSETLRSSNLEICFTVCGCTAKLTTGELRWEENQQTFVDSAVHYDNVVVRELNMIPHISLDTQRNDLLTSPIGLVKTQHRRMFHFVKQFLYLSRVKMLQCCSISTREVRAQLFNNGTISTQEITYWTCEKNDQIFQTVMETLEDVHTKNIPLWVYFQIITFWTCMGCHSFTDLIPFYSLRIYLNLIHPMRHLHELGIYNPDQDYQGTVYGKGLIDRIFSTSSLTKKQLLYNCWINAYNKLIYALLSDWQLELMGDAYLQYESMNHFLQMVQVVENFLEDKQIFVQKYNKQERDAITTSSLVKQTGEILLPEYETWANNNIKNFQTLQTIV